METVALVAAFLAFIAWRERQHAREKAALASRRGDKALASVVPSRRRKRGGSKARVISADDDAAFNEARGYETAENDAAVAEDDEESLEPGETEDED